MKGTLLCVNLDKWKDQSNHLFCLSQNELAIFELAHNFVEVLDKYFSRVVSLKYLKYILFKVANVDIHGHTFHMFLV